MDLRTYPDLNSALLGGATGAAGPLNAAKVHLTKAALDLSDATLLADLLAIQADYVGYAAKTVTWLAPSISDFGETEQVGTVPEFRPTANTTENVCYHVFVTDTAGTKLLIAGDLADAPVTMTEITDSLLITLRYSANSMATSVLVS